jgi:hypothetical protein
MDGSPLDPQEAEEILSGISSFRLAPAPSVTQADAPVLEAHRESLRAQLADVTVPLSLASPALRAEFVAEMKRELEERFLGSLINPQDDLGALAAFANAEPYTQRVLKAAQSAGAQTAASPVQELLAASPKRAQEFVYTALGAYLWLNKETWPLPEAEVWAEPGHPFWEPLGSPHTAVAKAQEGHGPNFFIPTIDMTVAEALRIVTPPLPSMVLAGAVGGGARSMEGGGAEVHFLMAELLKNRLTPPMLLARARAKLAGLGCRVECVTPLLVAAAGDPAEVAALYAARGSLEGPAGPCIEIGEDGDPIAEAAAQGPLLAAAYGPTITIRPVAPWFVKLRIRAEGGASILAPYKAARELISPDAGAGEIRHFALAKVPVMSCVKRLEEVPNEGKWPVLRENGERARCWTLYMPDPRILVPSPRLCALLVGAGLQITGVGRNACGRAVRLRVAEWSRTLQRGPLGLADFALAVEKASGSAFADSPPPPSSLWEPAGSRRDGRADSLAYIYQVSYEGSASFLADFLAEDGHDPTLTYANVYPLMSTVFGAPVAHQAEAMEWGKWVNDPKATQAYTDILTRFSLGQDLLPQVFSPNRVKGPLAGMNHNAARTFRMGALGGALVHEVTVEAIGAMGTVSTQTGMGAVQVEAREGLTMGHQDPRLPYRAEVAASGGDLAQPSLYALLEPGH